MKRLCDYVEEKLTLFKKVSYIDCKTITSVIKKINCSQMAIVSSRFQKSPFVIYITAKTTRIINIKSGKCGTARLHDTEFNVLVGIAIAFARYCNESIPEFNTFDIESIKSGDRVICDDRCVQGGGTLYTFNDWTIYIGDDFNRNNPKISPYVPITTLLSY